MLSAYRVEELIGRGGMGEVYLAHDRRLDRPVALKVLGADLAGDERFRERLLRESRLAAGLDHPNVVPIYEAGEVDGRLFIAMRYVEGTDLRALLRRHGPWPPERALRLGAQVAGALDAAHAARVGSPRRQAEQRARRRSRAGATTVPGRLRADRRALPIAGRRTVR